MRRVAPDPFATLHNTQWDSVRSTQEWIEDHQHLILHRIGYGQEYELEFGGTIETVLSVNNLHIGRKTQGVGLSASPLWVYKVEGHSMDNQGIDILMDTGASHTFTHCKEDFVDELRPCAMSIAGFTDNEINAEGLRTVLWYLKDEKGKQRAIKTEAYYVPDGGRRLFSPQQHFRNWEQTHGRSSRGQFAVTANQACFIDNKGWTACWTIGDLPIALGTNDHSMIQLVGELKSYNNVLNEDSPNISTSQKELLLWHQRMGHMGFGWVQRLMQHHTGPNDRDGYENPPCIPTTHPNT